MIALQAWPSRQSKMSAATDSSSSSVLSVDGEQAPARRSRTSTPGNGADLDARDASGHTKLHDAAFNGDAKVAEKLLENGASVEPVLPDTGATALHLAAYLGHAELADVLLRHGAAVDALDTSGNTALGLAASEGHAQVVRVLISHDATLEAKDEDNMTALFTAAIVGHTEVVRVLCQHGADVNASEHGGSNALDIATTRGHAEVVRVLQNCEANSGARDTSDETALRGTPGKKMLPAALAIPPPPAVGASSPGEPRRYELPRVIQFISSWLIDPQICDDMVRVFDTNPQARRNGRVYKRNASLPGGNTLVLDKSVKDSVEMSFDPNDPRPEWQAYIGALTDIINAYCEEYPQAAAYGVFGLLSRANLQYYPPGGGYKTYHTERTGAGEPEGSRHLVFMTYLNDVTDEGGTEFYHQGVTVQPVKGLTLVWPADWTFTHRGVPSPSQEKRILTGWFNFKS